MKLKDWAAQNNLSYSKAWRKYSSGELGGYKDENGVIHIGEKTSFIQNASNTTTIRPLPEPVGDVLFEEIASTRTNKSASIRPTDRFKHIDDGIIPFHYSTAGYGNTSDVSISDAIILAQKAYFNFSIVRTTIDLMSEFCVSEIFFRHGSKRSRDFFKAYCKKINLWGVQDEFYREFFRSGNVFLYKIEGEISQEDIKALNQVFGAEITNNKIPLRFCVLNPAEIHAHGSISFADLEYYKVMSDYEKERLRKPRTPEDKEVLESLPPEERKKIQDKKQAVVYLPLNKDNIVAVFYKKQGYEAFAVPFIFPVLEDINFKKELRLMDVALARAGQQIILLTTLGTEPDKGGINHKNLAAMQKLFLNESIARFIIADYTTKIEWVIPQIADILDPKKYEVVDKDIAIGLNNVLLGQGEKFANQHAKIEIFIERLKHARQAFLNEFLIPEIKRIAKNIGLKNYPEPYYEDIDLKNDIEYSKIYTRLAELGVLTPEETIDAIETGRLPTPEASVESQTKFKEHKSKGLYEPLIGGKKEGDGAGRPGGTKAPQTRKTISPIGTGAVVEEKYSLKKISENLILSQKLQESIEKELKAKYNLKKLNKEKLEIAGQITETIILNEESTQWENKIKEYIENPIDKNQEQINKILELGAEHQVENYLAGILYASRINQETKK